MPQHRFTVEVDALVAYAGWLEGSSGVLKDCADLAGRWCSPPGWAFGVDIPFLGDTAKKLHDFATSAVGARAEELQTLSGVLHGMAIGLGQVAADYTDADVQVVANFGNGTEVNPAVAGTLRRTYDIELEPHRVRR